MAIPMKRLKTVVLTALAIVAFFVWALYISTAHDLISVSVDETSTWGRHFSEETGFQFLVVRSRTGNRYYFDHVSFVGSNRSLAWFEQLGFKSFESSDAADWEEVSIREISGYALLHKKDKKDREATETACVLEHPMKNLTLFYYIPRTGMLSFSDYENLSD